MVTMATQQNELDALLELRASWREHGKQVVFTNGCFDILHRGHVEYLQQSRALGDVLIVGLNTDDSVRRLKGFNRPIVPQQDRQIILNALQCVDYVVCFDQETPEELILQIVPDILVKGADYKPDEIVGKKTVEAAGGKVMRIPLTPGRATRDVIQTIIERFGK